MKNAIAEYVRLSEEEKKNLWQSAYYVFDTNVYFDLYRYSKETRESTLAAMEGLSEQLWMPYHVAYEVAKGRFKIITENTKKFNDFKKETEKILDSCKQNLRIKEEDANYIKVKKHIDKINACVEEYQNNNIISDKEKDDVIFEILLKLYEGKVGERYCEEDLKLKYEEGHERYEKKIPPGYKDAKKQIENDNNNMYGDFIIWSQILDYATVKKVDIIFVTNDAKEDWWQKEEGKKIGARPELRREFKEKTGQKFNMYSLEGFLNIQAQRIGGKVNQATVEEVRAVSEEMQIGRQDKKVKIYSDMNYYRKYTKILKAMDHELQNLSGRLIALYEYLDDYKAFSLQYAKQGEDISQIPSRRELKIEVETVKAKIKEIENNKEQLEYTLRSSDERYHRYIH
ncbi:MAG: PIN domain-containing protein [Eubacteriales bacterium]